MRLYQNIPSYQIGDSGDTNYFGDTIYSMMKADLVIGDSGTPKDAVNNELAVIEAEVDNQNSDVNAYTFKSVGGDIKIKSDGTGIEFADGTKQIMSADDLLLEVSLSEEGLVGYWSLDDGAGITATDNSGNGNDGTLIHTPTWVDGKSGKCLDFNGVHDATGHYVTCGDVTALRITGELSISAWVYTHTAPTTQGRTVVSTFANVGHNGYNFGAIWISNDFTIGIYDSVGAGFFAAYTNFFVDKLNEWVHIVGTFKPSEYVRLYANGVLIDENTTNIPASISYGGTEPFVIGRRSVEDQSHFDGLIDEVRIYNRGLSVAEVRYLFLHPSGNIPAMMPTERIIDYSVQTEKLSVITREHINNISQTHKLNGWGEIHEDGSGSTTLMSLVDATVNGATTKVLRMTNNGCAVVRTKTFAVNHDKIYRITIWLKKSSTDGKIYFGLSAFDEINEGGEVGNAAGDKIIQRYNASTRAYISEDTNVYFKRDFDQTTWAEFTSYIVGANRDVNDCPQTKNADHIAKLKSDTTYVAIRILSWSNTSPQTLDICSPAVTEVGAGQIVESNVAFGTGTNEISAVNLPIADAGGNYVATEVEGTLTEIATGYFKLADNETVTGRPAFNGGASGSTSPFTVDSTYKVTNLNADLLDGYHAQVAAGGNTIVQRHSSGYIFANYFNTTPSDVTTGVTKVCVEKSNDGYIRHGTQAAIRIFIGAGSGNGLDADKVDGIHGSSFIRSDAGDNVVAHTEWQDNYQVRLGTDADFIMYFSGNNTVFRGCKHGACFYLQGEDSAGTNRNMIFANPGAQVQLYYAGNKKFETASGGAKVSGNLQITGAITQNDSWHYVGGSGEPAFQNSWANYGSSFVTCRFRKDMEGWVHIEGFVKNGTLGIACFALPSGYRPNAVHYMVTVSNSSTNPALTKLYPDGVVSPTWGTNTWHSLDIAPFKAEQ